MKVEEIKGPQQLKNLSIQELNELAADIRQFLIENISHTGGHLASNLGIVELCIAMHTVFNSPTDKIIFDVGHQSYVHKILTGRASQFSTLRQYNGLSGFQKRCESEHDPYEAGHSSTALSSALGFALARDYNHEDFQVVPVVGDASIMSGISLEALNTIGEKQSKMVIILNDNGMSISKNVGALSETFTKLRTSSLYNQTKRDLTHFLNKTKSGENVYHALQNMKNSVKKNIVETSFFGDFGIDYLGPVDGHHLPSLLQTLQIAKEHNGPIVVHVCTTKGKGYSFAENDTTGKWHGIAPFDIQTGQVKKSMPKHVTSWSQCISSALCECARANDDIITITPAMIAGSKLENFKEEFGDRLIDCGIAEDHAAILANGLACQGKRPFLSIYSSFLQRAYDPISHDIARMDTPVVIGIDRAGLVGEDGPTHHGTFDIQLLRCLPNFIVAQPKDASEARDLLHTAFAQSHPFAIRYPRGNVEISDKPMEIIPIGTWQSENIADTVKAVVIAYGPDVVSITQKARVNQCPILVVNARFMKPLDETMLISIANLNVPVIIYETDVLAGGLSSSILEFFNDRQLNVKIKRMGLGDHFVTAGSVPQLRKHEGIDLNSLFELIGEVIHG